MTAETTVVNQCNCGSSTIRGMSWHTGPTRVCLRHLFQDDVNVSGDELGNLLPFRGLHRVVALLVLPKVLQTSTRREPLRHLTQIGGGGGQVQLASLTRVKLLGDAAHLFTVVSGHS